MEMDLEKGNRLGRAIFGICALIGLVAAALLSIGLERARAAEDAVSVFTATNAIAEDPGIGSPVLELNGEYTYTLAFPYVTKPDYLMFHNFDTGDYGWTDFLNYHRLNPDQWYWGSNFGYEGGGGLRHDAYRGGGIREAHDALTMYLAPDAHGSDPQDWTDYRYTAKVKVIEGNQAGVWFRGTYIPNQPSGKYVGGYYFWISPNWGGVVQLEKLRNSGPTAGHFSDPLEIIDASFPIQWSKWHDIRIEVKGNQIWCFVDDTQVFNVTDSTWTHGTVGFMGYRMDDARFDQVLVEPLH
jgi:hypothetical protein